MKKSTIFKWISYVIGMLVIILTFLYMFNLKSTTGLFGYTARIVVSGSMEPAIPVNTVNIIKICDASELEVGDILCYKYDKDIIHRITEIKDVDGRIVINTRGDANKYADGIEITEDMVIGKVVSTIGWSKYIISKFSIEPGKVDGISMVKTIIQWVIILTLVFIVARKLIDLIILLWKAFFRDDNHIQIEKLGEKIEELDKHYKLDVKFNNTGVRNSSKTRLHYIFNKILKARTDFIVRKLERDIEDFNRDIRRVVYFDTLVSGLERGKDNSEIKRLLIDMKEQINEEKDNNNKNINNTDDTASKVDYEAGESNEGNWQI